MRAQDREQSLLIDVSAAANSAQACRLLEDTVDAQGSGRAVVDLNVGHLLLSRNVLIKMGQQLQKRGARFGTVYAQLPQTQQAALDEGLLVRQQPPAEKTASFLNSQTLQAWEAFIGQEPPLEKPSPEMLLKHPPVEPTEVEVPTAPPETRLAETSNLYTTEHVPSVHSASISVELAEETLFLKQTLRSGQTIHFEGNVIIVGDVHAGSEITAGGDIVIWGELRGIAHAGSQGNYKAEIRAMKIEALQLRIADYIARRPDRIYYHKDSGVNSQAPEVAKVSDGEIRIFKEMIGR